MTAPEPVTLVEQLDAARDGEEFACALMGFMAAFERERDAE